MLTVPQFCAQVRISRSLFQKLKREGRGPIITKIGSRVLVSEAATATWLQSQEQAPKKAA